MALTTAAAVIVAACSWNNPGADPYMGNVPDAVYSYADIPKAVQDKLHDRMARRDYDDMVEITGKSVVGAFGYENLRQMHFGNNRRCEEVDRSKWDGRLERGLVYCEGTYCLLVPTVCRNVSRIDRVLAVPDHYSKVERSFRDDEAERLRLLEELKRKRERERVNQVPEPSGLALLTLGLLALFGLRRKGRDA